jgi:hypothetical protein
LKTLFVLLVLCVTLVLSGCEYFSNSYNDVAEPGVQRMLHITLEQVSAGAAPQTISFSVARGEFSHVLQKVQSIDSIDLEFDDSDLDVGGGLGIGGGGDDSDDIPDGNWFINVSGRVIDISPEQARIYFDIKIQNAGDNRTTEFHQMVYAFAGQKMVLQQVALPKTKTDQKLLLTVYVIPAPNDPEIDRIQDLSPPENYLTDQKEEQPQEPQEPKITNNDPGADPLLGTKFTNDPLELDGMNGNGPAEEPTELEIPEEEPTEEPTELEILEEELTEEPTELEILEEELTEEPTELEIPTEE